MTASRLRILALGPLLALGACSDGGGTAGPAPPDSETEAVARRLGVLAVSIALAPRGAGPFDNALPCGHRGVILYRETLAGREVDVHGCDLGGGIVVDGSGEVRWVGPGLEDVRFDDACPAGDCPDALEWRGALTVSTDAGNGVVQTFRVEDLVLGAGGPTLPDPLDERGLGFGGMTVHLDDATVAVDDVSAFVDAMVPDLDRDAIANPSGSVAAWTDADLRRLAWDWLMFFGFLLVDETVEVRGTHDHDRPCGDLLVVRESPQDLPVLEFDWNGCEDRGVVASGDFEMRWVEFDPQAGDVTLEVVGTIELGGAVPRTDLRRIEWSASFPSAFPGRVRVSGELVDAGGASRAFDFEAVLDD